MKNKTTSFPHGFKKSSLVENNMNGLSLRRVIQSQAIRFKKRVLTKTEST